MTTRVAAAIIGCSVRRVRQFIFTGQLPAIKHGRDYLITKPALQAFAARERKPGRPQMYYYATQAPHGFANEINVHRFPSRLARDAWVDEHLNDGGVNSASQGARVCTAAAAREIVRRRGDAVTKQYNSLIEH